VEGFTVLPPSPRNVILAYLDSKCMEKGSGGWEELDYVEKHYKLIKSGRNGFIKALRKWKEYEES